MKVPYLFFKTRKPRIKEIGCVEKMCFSCPIQKTFLPSLKVLDIGERAKIINVESLSISMSNIIKLFKIICKY